MAKYTFHEAHIKQEQLRKDLIDAEYLYIKCMEKILNREHFKDGVFQPSAELSNISKLELQVSFHKLQKAFINWKIMANLAHTLLDKEYKTI